MKTYDIATTIHTDADTIWSLLTNAASYPAWNTTVVRVEGVIELGQNIKVFATISPKQAFPVQVSELITNKKMVWKGGMPLGLFNGVRTFSLSEEVQCVTQFRMTEVFDGLLSPLILKTMPDLTETFAEFTACLKKAAEHSK